MSENTSKNIWDPGPNSRVRERVREEGDSFATFLAKQIDNVAPCDRQIYAWISCAAVHADRVPGKGAAVAWAGDELIIEFLLPIRRVLFVFSGADRHTAPYWAVASKAGYRQQDNHGDLVVADVERLLVLADAHPALETIERAAILHNSAVFSIPRPGRHHTVFYEMHARDVQSDATSIQGFVTNIGRFVERSEAALIATAAGQLLRKTSPTYLLFSEDVW